MFIPTKLSFGDDEETKTVIRQMNFSFLRCWPGFLSHLERAGRDSFITRNVQKIDVAC
jgi:hypothetical protein